MQGAAFRLPPQIIEMSSHRSSWILLFPLGNLQSNQSYAELLKSQMSKATTPFRYRTDESIEADWLFLLPCRFHNKGIAPVIMGSPSSAAKGLGSFALDLSSAAGPSSVQARQQYPGLSALPCF